MDARKSREKAFHDQQYREVAYWQAVDKYYAITDVRVRFWDDFLRRQSSGRRVLEYGCGRGNYSLQLAGYGARVTGIDLSETAMQQAQAVARTRAVPIEFRVMDGEALAFADQTFDVICGNAILHHLDLQRSYAEVARALKPDGVAIFMEPLGHNLLINLHRRMTPELRTPDEHPLRVKDIKLARSYFETVEVHAFHLLSLLAVPLRRTAIFSQVLAVLDRVDAFLFARVPLTRRNAWYAVVVLRGPRPHGGQAGQAGRRVSDGD